MHVYFFFSCGTQQFSLPLPLPLLRHRYTNSTRKTQSPVTSLSVWIIQIKCSLLACSTDFKHTQHSLQHPTANTTHEQFNMTNIMMEGFVRSKIVQRMVS